MKTHLERLVPGAALLLACSAAHAGYTVEKGDLKAELGVSLGSAALFTRNTNFGAGRFDVRSLEVTDEDANWQEYFVTPSAKLNYSLSPDFSLVGAASAVAAATRGDGDAAGLTNGSDDSIDVEELYAGFESQGWRFTAGHQKFMIGNGFIVMNGNLDIFDDGAFWLAPRAAFRNSGVLRYDTDAYSVQGFSLETDTHMGGYRMNGVNVDYYLGERSMLGAMAMGVQSDNNSAARDGMRVYSVRGLGLNLPSLPDLTLSGEYAIQTGSGDGVDYGANAWFAEAEYVFSAFESRPRIGYRHSYFSGDDNLGDNTQKTWDPLAKGYVDWGTWVVGEITGNYLLNNSNEVVDQVWVKADLSPTMGIGAIHYDFKLDEANLFGAPVAGKDFGNETTLFLDWYPSESILASIAYSRVSPGKAAEAVFGNKDFSTLELYFSYRY